MKIKKITLIIIPLVFVVFFISLATLAINRLSLRHSEELLEDQLHDRKNEGLKELTLKVSPNQKKQAYFQRKFSEDNITNIDDQDYISIILDQGNGKEVLFQGNFRLSYLEWLNDDEVKIYKGCGSSCLVSYVVNTNTKETNEVVEKIIEQTP